MSREQSEIGPSAEEPVETPRRTSDRGGGERPHRRGEESGSGRGRHRRRRRGPGKERAVPEPLEPELVTVETAAGGIPAEVHEEAEDFEDGLQLPEAEAAAEGVPEEDGGEVSASEKAIHRAIPSWQEVVGIVISANMASRAKNPDRRSSGRSRSGRDRGRRDKPSEKAD